MTAYAQGTTVPISRSKAEIEEMITKRKGKNFAAGSHDNRAIVAFELDKRKIRIEFAMPLEDDFRTAVKYGEERPLNPEQRSKAYDAECRRRWRALVLIIKAKLEAVESGISDTASEFLANIVVPGGKTFGEWAGPQLQAAYERGVNMPNLLGTGSS